MAKSVITGSFDGLHKGHEYIIQEAAKRSEELHILIGTNGEKKGIFDIQTRIDHLTKSTRKLTNINIKTYEESLLVDYMTRNNIITVFKGIRNEQDKSFEKTQEYYNNLLSPDISTEYIECHPDYFHLSSSGIKSLFTIGGNMTPGIEKLISLHVKQDLEKTLNNQYIIGITGIPGSGKSYIAQQLVQQAEELKLPITHLSMDKLGHRIYHQSNYSHMRDQIMDLDPSITTDEDGKINKNSVRDAMFSNSNTKSQINELFQQPIRTELRQEIYGKTGIILIESALFAEHDISDIVNNNLILVKTDSDTQLKRLQERGDDMSTITQFLDGQYNTETKEKVLKEKINQSGHGTLITVDNSGSGPSLSHIIDDIKKTVSYLP